MRTLFWIGTKATRVGGIAATIALVAGCVAAGSLTAPLDASSPAPTSPAPTATSAPSPAAWGDCGNASEFVEYAPYTVASLAASGYIFVEGVATSFEPGVFNTADGQPPRGFFIRPWLVPDRQDNGHIFTPVVIRVDQVLAGDVKPGALRAFIEGGTVGCWTVRLSGAPVVNLNERYVFILRGYYDADGKVVPGQHQVTFAWPIEADDQVWTVEGPMALTSLAKIVAKASPTPTATSVPSPAASGNCGTRSWSVEYAPYTIRGLAANGDILVAGVATAFEPGVFNTADGKPPRGFFARHGTVPDAQEYGGIYTPVVIEVEQVFAGEVKPGALRAYVEGGTLGCWTMTVDVPRVELEKRYVFVLNNYRDADGKVVPGQHKVFLALPIDANDVVQQGGTDVFGNPANEGPMSLATLAQLAARAASTPAP